METAPLKTFATKARTEMIKEVAGRISVVLAKNSLARVEAAAAVHALERAIACDDLERVTDRVAYTWFNRIIALRFMDANGFTGSGIVSPAAGQFNGQPEVLAEAKAGVFDDAIVSKRTQETITALFNGTRASQDRDGEAYGMLLEAYCRSWNDAMPFMFEREGDYTELLIPTALLAADSVRDRAVKTLTEEVCRDVEVVGWLYQFYISDRKDEVFDGFKKNKKAGAAEIPAATQLFTPHWIVRYLVENSLGRLWLLNNPSSRLAEQMDYYIKPVDEETDFLRIAKPEELKVIDPAVGSGHMLTYAFDLLHAIYSEKGYDPAEIPGLILEHNLYGTEIDPRAGALAAFALTMKAAAKRKLFLKNPAQPNIRVLENVHFDPAELDYLWSLTKADGFARDDADEFWNTFEHADTFGSLIQPNEQLLAPLKATVEGVSTERDLLSGKTLEKAAAVIKQAEYLSGRYGVVIANPPYMGIGNMGSDLANFLKATFKGVHGDLFSSFAARLVDLAAQSGRIGVMTPNVWMYISAHRKMRDLFSGGEASLVCLVELPLGGFKGATVQISAFVAVRGRISGDTHFTRLVDVSTDEASLSAALHDSATSPTESTYSRRVSLEALRALPGRSFAYALPKRALSAYRAGVGLQAHAHGQPGLQTSNNARFVRFWWEISSSRLERTAKSSDEAVQSGARWFPYLKGGEYRKWYGNELNVVDWEQNGARIKEYVTEIYPYLKGNIDYVVKDRGYYFRPMISYTKIGTGRFAARYAGAGHLFDVAGSAVFPAEDETELVLGFLCSAVGEMFLRAQNPTLNVQSGDIDRLPFDRAALQAHAERITLAVAELVDIARRDWDSRERSMDFPKLALLDGTPNSPSTLRIAVERLASEQQANVARSTILEALVNKEFLTAYGLADVAETGLTPAPVTPEVQETREVTSDLVSYAVGCMFGRYSLDKPGLILADQGSALQDYLAQVPTPSFMPDKDNVIPIVDGDWFEDDIVAGFRQFLRAAFGDEHFEENLRFVTESLGVKDIRDYFVKSFYGDHVKRYKKRPIYWQFRSPKGSFSALICLHRYGPSTVSTVLTGYLREFIGKLEANLEHQGRVAAGMGGASARDIANAQKEADRIRKVLRELHDYEHDTLFPLAGQQIALDLDDGVLVNYQKLGAALKDIGLKKGNSGE